MIICYRKYGSAMIAYQDSKGKSPVLSFKIGTHYIDVEFSSGWVYRYDYDSAGRYNVERMKRLAELGEGLGSFVSRRVRKRYTSKRRKDHWLSVLA